MQLLWAVGTYLLKICFENGIERNIDSAYGVCIHVFFMKHVFQARLNVS